MTRTRSLLVALLLCVLVPAVAAPQALTSLSSLRVGYNTRKATVKPEGELKAHIDALDKQIAEAARLGRSAELRRLFAKGTSLLAGRPWTDELDYATSLVLRSDRVIVDSSKPYSVRLEQLYSPSIELQRTLTARVAVRKRPAGPGAAAQPAEIVKDLGTFNGVSRDLRDAPFPFELDLRDVPDGTYQLSVDVLDDTRSLGSSTLSIALRNGLDEALVRLDNEAKRAPEAFRADILYPGDRIRNANRGRIELRTFDMAGDLAAAESVVAAVEAGKDAYAGRTGDFKRHYLLDPAGEIMPYRLYVPKTYTPARAFPLIIALHGLGATEDSLFDGYGRTLPPLAEQRGYIVAAPLGYRVDGFYGYLAITGADEASRKRAALSEQDVMEVLRRVREHYKVDDSRIYLMGHSMGAIGTWAIAAKYPDIWAAVAPISGLGNPATAEQMRHLPQIVVHGDADPTVSVEGSRTMVAAMKKAGIDVKYVEVPGGNHIDIAAPNFPAILDFFDAHPPSPRSGRFATRPASAGSAVRPSGGPPRTDLAEARRAEAARSTSSAPVEFRAHVIEPKFPGGYAVHVVDINKDGKLDVIGNSTRFPELAWYENPTWERHLMVDGLDGIVNLAAHDIDGDGIPEIALQSSFAMVAAKSEGLVWLLRHQGDPRQRWKAERVDQFTTSHHVAWADIDGDGKKELINAPLIGPKSLAPTYDQDKASLFWYRPGDWKRQAIADDIPGILHRVRPVNWDNDRREEILAASFDGIRLYRSTGSGANVKWESRLLSPGHNQDEAPRLGASDVAVGRMNGRRILASVEPWHGREIVVYTEDRAGNWERRVLFNEMVEGHEVAVADFNGDGRDDIVAGDRNAKGATVHVMYAPADPSGQWQHQALDPGTMAASGCVTADINSDRRPDIVCIGSSTGNIKWYENVAPATPSTR